MSLLKGQERKYKVYSAVLTQTGSTAYLYADSGALTIGVTYTIKTNSPGMDFTNVGAPNNDLITRFVATGENPNSWGENEGTSNSTLQYNTATPVVTVLENTIGNVYWEYSGVGHYSAHSYASPFTEGMTFCVIGTSNNINSVASPAAIEIYTEGSDTVHINTAANKGNITPTDSALVNTAVEIRVYN